MICKATPENIVRAAELLDSGELVAFPTETVYGLGAVAFNESACNQIFKVKGRPFFDPLIVHIASFDELSEVANWESDQNTRENVIKLQTFWPGPLTLILPKTDKVPGIVTAGKPSVAVRIPSHPIALSLLQTLKRPVAAPSANPFSYVSPTTAKHVDDLIGSKIAMVLDGGPTQFGIESTILSLLGDAPEILRPGVITHEQLSQIISNLQAHKTRPVPTLNPAAPGMLEMHYAPRTKMIFFEDYRPQASQGKIGYIAFKSPATIDSRFSPVSILSKDGDLAEVAHKLFAAIREQDSLDLDLIVIDSCSEAGVGVAIMDRLRKAVAR